MTEATANGSRQDPLLDALLVVCKHYGLTVTPRSLTLGLPLTEGLLTPTLLPRAAEKAGLEALRVEASLDELSSDLLPVIALTEEYGACVLTAVSDELVDIQVGNHQLEPLRIPREAFLNNHTGMVFLLKNVRRMMKESPNPWIKTKGTGFGVPCGNRAVFTGMYFSPPCLSIYSRLSATVCPAGLRQNCPQPGV